MSHRGTITRAFEATGAIIQDDARAALERAIDAALTATRMDALEEAAQMAEIDARAISKGAHGRMGSTTAVGDHIAQAIRALASIERAEQSDGIQKAEG